MTRKTRMEDMEPEEFTIEERAYAEASGQISPALGNEYLRTPDGCYWIQEGDMLRPLSSMDAVYRLGLRPVRGVSFEDIEDAEKGEAII